MRSASTVLAESFCILEQGIAQDFVTSLLVSDHAYILKIRHLKTFVDYVLRISATYRSQGNLQAQRRNFSEFLDYRFTPCIVVSFSLVFLEEFAYTVRGEAVSKAR